MSGLALWLEGLRLLLMLTLPVAVAGLLASLLAYALSRATGWSDGLIAPLARATSVTLTLLIAGPHLFEALRRFAAAAWGGMGAG